MEDDDQGKADNDLSNKNPPVSSSDEKTGLYLHGCRRQGIDWGARRRGGGHVAGPRPSSAVRRRRDGGGGGCGGIVEGVLDDGGHVLWADPEAGEDELGRLEPGVVHGGLPVARLFQPYGGLLSVTTVRDIFRQGHHL